jgi:tetratricopeptide (TPR) repeat protein
MAGKIAKAAMHASEGRFDEALSAYDSVIAVASDDPAVQAKRREAFLGKAVVLEKQQQHEKAARLLETLIDELPPDSARLQAETYLRLGGILERQGKSKEAVLAYLHVDVLFAGEKPLHAESLYQLSRLWASLGYVDRAADASSRLKQDYPDSPWAKKISASR